jgi:hypothetical protein
MRSPAPERTGNGAEGASDRAVAHKSRKYRTRALPSSVLRIHKGQPYLAIAADPYTRRDGRDTFVITWFSWCADCRAPFTLSYAGKWVMGV